ncbi:MAG: hypothetical protein RDV48_05790 [Candidatus Eremiobacteraeota bacterium]|nr:hypothetical protein [Candidatus Eremiobacteraeota bacterium]
MNNEDQEERLPGELTIVRAALKTPRAAAIAGIVFSIVYITILFLIRISVPPSPLDAGAWLSGRWKYVDLALQLMPFAGIAFLWFMGVIRDRIGHREDRFFSTVFLGSGYLFVGMLFSASAVAGTTIMLYGAAPEKVIESGMYSFARALSYQFMNIFGIKMAAVFMAMTSTLLLRTGVVPRWIAILGYPLALALLLCSGIFHWFPLFLPLWVLMVSLYILISNLA